MAEPPVPSDAAEPPPTAHQPAGEAPLHPPLAAPLTPPVSPSIVDHWPGASAAEPDAPPQAWGFWATTGWLLAAAAIVLSLQVAAGIVVGVAYAAMQAAGGGPLAGIEQFFEDHYGLFAAIFGTLSMAAAIAFLALPIRLRRWRLVDYLALRRVSWVQVVVATAAMVAMVALESTFAIFLDRPVPPDMLDLRRTAIVLPLLWFFIVAVAPVAEEVIFRGFAYRGWAATRIGPVGAILLTSLIWTAVHIQYELYELTWVFLLGLVLGATRWRTGSTTLCILMHAVFNLLATVLLEYHWATL